MNLIVESSSGEQMTPDPAELNDLLAHCAATPDDTPRLVLADWLEEHDDFRGEFVRAAVAFDRTPPYDSTRFQLAERLRSLLDTPAVADVRPAPATAVPPLPQAQGEERPREQAMKAIDR
jgi:uncharacterized protein (TIGR02996 family)